MRKILGMTPIAAAALIALAVRGDRSFQASADRSYADLMKEAMERMHEGMTARQTGNPDRDFVIQMIPHHQGAIDMAEALLIYGKDPELRQLAKGIIVEQ